MKDPNESDIQELKRAARYLLKFPRAVLSFEEPESCMVGLIATRPVMWSHDVPHQESQSCTVNIA